MVLGAGIEPAHSEEYRILSPVRLPIPPPKHFEKDTTMKAKLQKAKYKFFARYDILNADGTICMD